MIARHLSLVPVNPFQRAALQAIIEVEERRQRGQYPYAVALLRQLRGGGAGRIGAADVRRAASNYNPKDRAGEPKARYLAALDKLIESRGSVCPLPLSGCAVGQYFPQTAYRHAERQHRRWDVNCRRRKTSRKRRGSKSADGIRSRWHRLKSNWRSSRRQHSPHGTGSRKIGASTMMT